VQTGFYLLKFLGIQDFFGNKELEELFMENSFKTEILLFLIGICILLIAILASDIRKKAKPTSFLEGNRTYRSDAITMIQGVM